MPFPLAKIQPVTRQVYTPVKLMRNTPDNVQATENQAVDKHHKRALAVLLEKSVAAIGIGAACMVAPSFLEPSPTAVAIASGLRMGGWIAIGVGLVLFCVRLSVQSKTRKRASLPRRDTSRQETIHDQPEFPGFGVDAAATTPSFALRSSAGSSSDVNIK